MYVGPPSAADVGKQILLDQARKFRADAKEIIENARAFELIVKCGTDKQILSVVDALDAHNRVAAGLPEEFPDVSN